MKKTFLFLLAALSLVVSCNKSNFDEVKGGEEILIGLSTLGIDYEALPTRATEGEDLLAVQVYEGETPYAKGLFSSWDNLTFKGFAGSTYKVEATMVVEATAKLAETGKKYGLPFSSAVSANGFVYSETPMEGLASGTATLADGVEYTTPLLDRYYGAASKEVSVADSKISVNMKRMAFGIKTSGIEESVSLQIAGAPQVELAPKEIAIFSLSNFTEAYTADETDAPYAEAKEVEITRNGNVILNQSVDFRRNCLATVTINGNDVTLGFNFEEDNILGELTLANNLYYNETQLTVAQNYWVITEDASNVKWYVNGELKESGVADFSFTAEEVGSYNIKVVAGREFKECVSKVYSANGVYILNEPNMTATEQLRGINRHIWDEETVTRFVEGDYTMFGTTNQYIQNWAGKLYCVASYPQSGVSFSSFDALSGSFAKALTDVNGAGSAELRGFAGINEEVGIINLKSGAYLVDLTSFTVESTPLQNSADAKNILVSDGHVFIICGSSVQVYSVDNLSSSSESTTLGTATCGFVKSIDGTIWAANGGELLAINPKDLSVETKSIPDGVTVKFASSPWKQVSWVASTSENCFYFNKDSWGSGSATYRYDIDAETIETFLTAADDFENGMLYGTSLYFDAELNQLVAQSIKGYGANSDYTYVWRYDTEGNLVKRVEYLGLGNKDMWFPAMMTPIKNY